MNNNDEAARSTHQAVDVMLASELNNLTFAERNTVLEDVHGVGDLAPEECDPNLMQERFQQMNVALWSIPVKPAFDEAQRLCGGEPRGLVNDPAFRIKFLRAERFNAYNAAVRMVKNLQVLRETFGPEGLMRPVHISDMMLDQENQGSEKFLFSGFFFQVMPFRDRLGRRVVVRCSKNVFEAVNIDIITRMKSLLYVCQQLSNDIECQMNGVVIIGFPYLDNVRNGASPQINGSIREIYHILSQKLVPVRIAAVHLCFPDDPWFRLASSLVLQALPKEFRMRSRIHTGSIDECCYKLMTYGIPGQQIPITSSGIIKCSDHKRFIAFCQERENAFFRNNGEFRGVFCPSSKDILVGRGPRVKSHIGNETYRIHLQYKYEQYNSASITKKKDIAFEVIQEVHSYGGRFLVRVQNCWIETDNETAKNKISIAFRDIRKALNAKKNRNYTNSVSKELSAAAINIEKMDHSCM